MSGGTITSGLGTPSITVDTSGMGGRPVKAFLDVTDDVYGSTCMQKNEVETNVDSQELPKPYQCDIFESKSRDDDKARFDNCVLRLQETPNSQIYVILYQGTTKGSLNVDRLSKQTLDYFVKTRGVDPRQIVITKGEARPKRRSKSGLFRPEHSRLCRGNKELEKRRKGERETLTSFPFFFYLSESVINVYGRSILHFKGRRVVTQALYVVSRP